METKKTTMFLNDITCLDHAYINDEGLIAGRSFHVSCDVSGKVDEVEQVVVDFSTIKKDLKGVIDQYFDHKLWVTANNCGTINEIPNIDSNPPLLVITVGTNHSLVMQKDAVCFLADENDIAKVLISELTLKYPNVGLDIVVHLTETPHIRESKNSVIWPFSYVHGLKNSTSYGCQNIAHGHSSFLQVEFHDLNDSKQEQRMIYDVLQQWNNKIFAWRENIYEAQEFIEIEYHSPRGYWYCNVQHGNYIIFDEETTIGNLLDAFCSRPPVVEAINTGKVKSIYMSEGLSKGAVKRF